MMKERSRARVNRSNKNKKKSLRSQLINSKLNVFLNQKVKRNELIFIDLILNFYQLIEYIQVKYGLLYV